MNDENQEIPGCVNNVWELLTLLAQMLILLVLVASVFAIVLVGPETFFHMQYILLLLSILYGIFGMVAITEGSKIEFAKILLMGIVAALALLAPLLLADFDGWKFLGFASAITVLEGTIAIITVSHFPLK